MSQISYTVGADFSHYNVRSTLTHGLATDQQWLLHFSEGFGLAVYSDQSGSIGVQDGRTGAVLQRDSGGLFADFSDNTVGVTLNGGNFGDSLVGGTAADHLFGDLGDDTLVSGGGADTLEGGGGSNTASYITAASGVTVDLSIQGVAQDTGVGSQLLTDIVNLTGSDYADLLRGDRRANVVSVGGGGADTVVGGAGVDTLSYADATAGVHANLAIKGVAQDTGLGLQVVTGFENLTGSTHADVLTGDKGGNLIDGGVDADRELGGKGNDTLVSDGGNDTLTGGGGADAFIFTALNGNSDRKAAFITDFTADDSVDLTAAAHALGLDHFTEVAQFTGEAGEVVVQYSAGNDRTVLSFDLHGEGGMSQRLYLNGDHTDLANITGVDTSGMVV